MRLRTLTALALVTVLGATIAQTLPGVGRDSGSMALDLESQAGATPTPSPGAMRTMAVPGTPTPTVPSRGTPRTESAVSTTSASGPSSPPTDTRSAPAVLASPTRAATTRGATARTADTTTGLAPGLGTPAGSGSPAGAPAATGGVHTGVATYYDADGGGNCSYDPGEDLAVAAMNQTDYQNSRACGGHVRVTGPSGTTVVRIVDRCPECPPGALDLSPQAFARIAPLVAGKVEITWTEIKDPTPSPVVRFRYKDGSTSYWCALQILDASRTIDTVWLDGTRLQRQEYNYFTSADGSGCGGRITVKDTRGASITADGIGVRPMVVQNGRSQFP